MWIMQRILNMSDKTILNNEYQFGKRIQLERQRLGLSQSDCATVTGLSRHTQSDWENNEATPNAQVLMIWSKIGFDIQYIMTGQYSGFTDCDALFVILDVFNKNDQRTKTIISQIFVMMGTFCVSSQQKRTSLNLKAIISQKQLTAFGQRVKEERSRLQLKQTDLASLIQTSRTSQSIWESGQRFPNLTVLLAWQEMGFDVSYLITGRRLNHVMTTEEQRIIDIWQQANSEMRTALSAVVHLIVGDQSDEAESI